DTLHYTLFRTFFHFCFNDTSPTEIYTLSLHDALPILMSAGATDGSFLRNAGIPTYGNSGLAGDVDDVRAHGKDERVAVKSFFERSEEHTSELQSRFDLVCRLLLEKKKKKKN